MIITQTPLRIGLVGGGTDLPDYYVSTAGRVLNCAIDKYVYVIVKQRFDDEIYVNYSKKEIVSKVDELEHELVREAMHMTGVDQGVEITMLADIPSSGSGLGSSSSVTVGLLQALWAYQHQHVPAEELAESACEIEIEQCGKRIGKQDQYIAALGGIQDIHFGPGDKVVADELGLSAEARRALQEQVMLFYTGVTRSATHYPERAVEERRDTPCQLPCSARPGRRGRRGLEMGDVDSLGAVIRRSWEAKRKLASGVTNQQIDPAVELGSGGRGVRRQGHRCRRRWLPARDLPHRKPEVCAAEPFSHAGAADRVRPVRLPCCLQRHEGHLELTTTHESFLRGALARLARSELGTN